MQQNDASFAYEILNLTPSTARNLIFFAFLEPILPSIRLQATLPHIFREMKKDPPGLDRRCKYPIYQLFPPSSQKIHLLV